MDRKEDDEQWVSGIRVETVSYTRFEREMIARQWFSHRPGANVEIIDILIIKFLVQQLSYI